MKKTAKKRADEIFNSHYMVLLDSDSDKGQEILVSLLAKKSALITVETILHSGLTLTQIKYYEEVKKHLESANE